MIWPILLVAIVAIVESSNHQRIQSVEDQQWLKNRDEVRELELQQQRNIGKNFDRHLRETHFLTLVAPLAPAFLMGTILVSYWLYLTVRAHRRSHFN